MKRHPRRTPEDIASERAERLALSERTRLIRAELRDSGSVFAAVPDEDVLGFAVERIRAELGAP